MASLQSRHFFTCTLTLSFLSKCSPHLVSCVQTASSTICMSRLERETSCLCKYYLGTTFCFEATVIVGWTVLKHCILSTYPLELNMQSIKSSLRHRLRCFAFGWSENLAGLLYLSSCSRTVQSRSRHSQPTFPSFGIFVICYFPPVDT